MEALIRKHEAETRIALAKASDAWQAFRREYGLFSEKSDPEKEESLWQTLTSARKAHDAAYAMYEKL